MKLSMYAKHKTPKMEYLACVLHLNIQHHQTGIVKTTPYVLKGQ